MLILDQNSYAYFGLKFKTQVIKYQDSNNTQINFLSRNTTKKQEFKTKKQEFKLKQISYADFGLKFF